MPAASRVRLAPLAPLHDDALVHAARTLVPTRAPVRPGDAVGDALVVLTVEPGPGAALVDATELELTPTPRTADARQVEVAILLDASESMGTPWDAIHTRLEAARVSIGSFLAAPPASVAAVAIHHYATDARLAAAFAPPRELTLPPAPKPRAASDTAAALDATLAALAARTRAGISQVVLLLTDGVGQVDELLAAAERAGRLRVPVHCLVFAPEVDPAFDEVARRSGGSVQQASHPLTLEFIHQPGG